MTRPLILLLLCLGLVGKTGRTGAAEPPHVLMSTLAGDYYQGDGLGANLSLKLRASGSFAFTWAGCGGLYGENNGPAAVKSGVLRLAPTKPNQRDHFGTDTRFYPVRWGKRVYLLTAEDIPGFCNAVNLGEEPRKTAYGRFYLGEGQWKKPVKGSPTLPEAFRSGILSASIQGEVTGLITDHSGWLNLGGMDGVVPGMAFKLKGARADDHSPFEVHVADIEDHRCQIVSQDADRHLEVGQPLINPLTP